MEEIFSSNSIKVIQKELDVSLVNNSSLKSNDEFDFYFDIQNALLAKNPSIPTYTFERAADNTSFKTTDKKALNPNGSNGIPFIIADATASITPGLGLIWEF